MLAGLRFLAAVAVSAIVSGVAGGIIVKLGKKWGIVDDPEKHKLPKVVHETAVPRGGGLAVMAGVAAGAGLFMPWETKTLGVMAGAAILAVTGWVDDRYQEAVSPYVRLVMNGLAALAVIGVGVGIAYVTSPWGGVIRLDWPRWCFMLSGTSHCVWVLADVFALLWLIWMQNIVGWSSGVDGQLPGFVIIAALTMAGLGARFGTDAGQWGMIGLAGVTAGAFLGFLVWNWYPQKMMPGYGGKSLAGFLLGVLAIMSGAKVGAMMMVLGVPFVDGVMVIMKRLKEGRSPVWGGREHLHHYLLEMGWGKRRIAGFYWMISGVMAILALQLNSTSKYFTMAAAGLVLGGIIIWLHYFSTYLKHPDQDNGLRT